MEDILTIHENLIIRYFTGTATADEHRQLLAWVNENPNNERELFILKDIYEANGYANLSVEAQTEAEFLKFQETVASIKHKKVSNRQSTSESSPLTSFMKYAAIFIIGFMLGSLAIYFFSSPRSRNDVPAIIAKPFEIKTEKGERATIYLPDGSKVALNACSFLSYPADFGENVRELTLIGEGYFEVQSNPNMPFIVKTSGLNIKAFGTIFNVRAYLDEDIVQTTLVSGCVSIESDNSIISLKPAQVVTIPKRFVEPEYSNSTNGNSDVKQDTSKTIIKEELVLKDKINPEVYTSWIDNKWIIESESLESLAV